MGYSYDAVKIIMPVGAKKPIYAPHVEHVSPDTTASIFWLKNRDPGHWRDAWQIEASVGKYIISEEPMTLEQWIAERATIVDAEPAQLEAKPRGGLLPGADPDIGGDDLLHSSSRITRS